MKIALINENSQAAKNKLILDALEKVVIPMGHTVDDYGMYGPEDKAQLTYVQCGILGAILLNSGAADYVITGCGVALPFAKGFGWGGELNLTYIFEKLFGFGHGQGYPPERVEPEMRNKKILDEVRAQTLRPLTECLDRIDQELVKGAVAGEHFKELFFASCKDAAIREYVEKLL